MKQIYNTTVNLKIGTNEGLTLLQAQKYALLKMIEQKDTPKVLNGLVHLIDHIQDSLADKNGVPEKAVFGELGRN